MEENKKIFRRCSELLKSVPNWALALSAVATVMMNLLANKSIETGVSWLALDSGIFISWVMFLVMDTITQKCGAKASFLVSFFDLIVNLGLSLIFLAVSSVKGLWSASFLEDGSVSEIVNIGIDFTFKGTWYVLLGSSIAFIVATFVDVSINVVIGKAFKNDKHPKIAYVCRAYGSTVVSQFIDNLIFALLVSCAFFDWTIAQAFVCAAAGALVECVCQLVFAPIGYLLTKKKGSQK